MGAVNCRIALGAALACSVVLAGDLTDRFQLTLDRVTKGGPPRYTPDLILADVIPQPTRRFTEYSGDVSGRYIGALASAEPAGNTIPSIRAIVAGILKLQKPDGHFGIAFTADIGHDDMALLWGNGRLLIGMLEYYERHPSPALLESARHLGDFLVRIAPQMNSDSLQNRVDQGDFAAAYICWTQQIEGLVALTRATGDQKYIDLARQIAARIHRIPAQHGHGFLTSLRGLVALYQATGDRIFLDQAILERQGIIESGNLLPQGAVPEAFAPRIRRDEGCAEADWLRLNLALWRITRSREYLDQAQLTLFNEYAVNQFSTGDFGSRVFSPTGISVGIDADGAGAARCWWCCTLHGLRAFRDIMDSVFHGDHADLWYDLPIEGRGHADGIAAAAESFLETRGSVQLRITAADAHPHRLHIMNPSWAESVNISINGAAPMHGAGVARTWKTGDRIEVTYAMRTQVIPVPKTGRYTIFYGPWMLGADEQLSPFFWDEPYNDNRLRISTGRDVHLERASVAPGRFAIPIARFQAGYLPEGYPMLPQKVLLRPIAEQTGSPSTAWYFLFKLDMAASDPPHAGAEQEN